MHKTELIAALDTHTLKAAGSLIDRLEGSVKYFKIGSVLFTAEGPAAVDLVHKRGGKVFLDLKFHDIPNTVKGAVKNAQAMGVYSVSLHLSGGAEMLKACAELEKRPKLWGITVLTSFDEHNLFRAGFRGGIDKTVKLLAALGLDCGMDGVVCSPLEAGKVHKSCGKGFLTVTPGVRFADGEAGDQSRVATPARAKELGSDYIVVGRPITGAPDPLAAYERCMKEFTEENR